MDVGIVTKTTVNRLHAAGDISTQKFNVFYTGAEAFFVRAFEYACQHMPIDDDFLVNAQFVEFGCRESCSSAMPQYFAQRYE